MIMEMVTIAGKKRSKKKFRFIDLFAGIGGIRLGLELAGGNCVFSSEWDPFAKKTYEHRFREEPQEVFILKLPFLKFKAQFLNGIACFRNVGIR